MKRIPVWCGILITGFIIYWGFKSYEDKHYCQCTIGGDYYAYYQFGKHHVRETVWPTEYQRIVNHVLAKYGGKANFMYAEATYPFFWFISLPPIETAYLLWYIGQVLCALWVAWRLLRIDYGWIWVLAGIKIAIFNFESGNIALYLAALGTTTFGSFASALFKPHYLIVAFIPSILQRTWERSKWLMIGLSAGVLTLAIENVWLQVVEGNDGTTWVVNKYWILFPPVILQLWKIDSFRKHWWIVGVLGSALLALSCWMWWLSPATRSFLISEHALLWLVVGLCALTLIGVGAIVSGFLFLSDDEKDKLNH